MYEEKKKKRGEPGVDGNISLYPWCKVHVYLYIKIHAPCTKVNNYKSMYFVIEKFVLSLRPDFSTTKGSHMQTK
jgi:hypothetical protein